MTVGSTAQKVKVRILSAHSRELQSSEIRSLTLKSSGVGFNGEKRSSVPDTGTEMAGSVPARQNRVHVETALISLRLVAPLSLRWGNILGGYYG